MDPEKESAPPTFVTKQAKKSIKDQLQPIIEVIVRHKTASFLVGWAIVTVGLVSGMVVMSANKNNPSATPNLPPLTYPTPSPESSASADLTPSSTISATPAFDPTASWKTYSNSKYGYSIKHPFDWAASDIGSSDPKIPSFITLNPVEATPAATLAITISTTTRTYTEVIGLKNKTRESITLSGAKGIKTTEKDSGGNETIHIVLPGKTFTYILVGKKKYEDFFTDIYPTFKLLP